MLPHPHSAERGHCTPLGGKVLPLLRTKFSGVFVVEVDFREVLSKYLGAFRGIPGLADLLALMAATSQSHRLRACFRSCSDCFVAGWAFAWQCVSDAGAFGEELLEQYGHVRCLALLPKLDEIHEAAALCLPAGI